MLQRSLTNFKEQILERIVSDSKYLNQAFANHIKLSNKALRSIMQMDIGSSKLIKLQLSDVTLSSECRKHFVRIKSRALCSKKYILPQSYDVEVILELFITKLSETEFKINFEDEWKVFGDDSVDNLTNNEHHSIKMKDITEKIMSDPNKLFNDFKEYFKCEDEDVEYNLDNFVRINDITSEFPHNYHTSELVEFYLTRVEKYRMMPADALDISEKFEFTIFIDATETHRSNGRTNLHKNIVYYERSNYWQVTITRNLQTFCVKTDNLEDAIMIRNKVFKFYEDHARIPTLEEVGYKHLSKSDKDYNIRYDTTDDSWTLVIKRDSRMFKIRMKSESEINETKDRVLEFYAENNTLPTLSDLNLEHYYTSEARIRNVYYIKLFDVWKCSIGRNRQTFKALTKSCNEAIEVRDKVLEFYRVNGKLPTHDEIGFVSASKSKSKSKMHHITKSSSGNSYTVQFSRNYAKFSVIVYDLQEAMKVRDRALEFYEKHRKLPTHEDIGFDNKSKRCIK